MATAAELSQLQALCNTALATDAFAVAADGSGLTLGPAPSGGTANVTAAVGSSAGDFTLSLANPAGTYSPSSPVTAKMFGGFPLELWSLTLTVTGGTAVSAARASARLAVPMFVHRGQVEKIDVDMSVGDGQVSLALADAQSDPARRNDDGKVIIDLTTNATGDGLLSSVALELATTQIGTLSQDGKVWISFDGELSVKVASDGSDEGDKKAGSFDFPKVEFKGLRISSDGEVGLDGGWLDLPKKARLGLGPFKLIAKKVGLGADKATDGTVDHWLGFDAEVNIGEGIEIGGSVRGFKIGLDSGLVSFDGIDVSQKVPGVFEFKGSLDHVYAKDKAAWGNQDSNIALPQDGGKFGPIYPLDLLKGSTQLKILPIHLEIDADLVTGNIGSANVFAIAVAGFFTPGFPLFAGISLTGLQGLFAYNLRPDPTSMGNTWWEWYQFPTDTSSGTILTGTGRPAVDPTAPAANDSTAKDDSDGADDDSDSSAGQFTATDLNKWMFPRHGALAFGAGATVGSQPANGNFVSATMVFILIMPGPVLMLVGTADILKAPKKSPRSPGLFNAMAVLDVEAGSFDMAIEVHYKKPAVIDVHGTAELFVKPDTGWYLALGKPRHDKRISARVLDIFEVDAYFLIGDAGLQFGVYIGYDKSWDFGPLSVGVKAFIAGIAAVQWRPLEVGAGLEIHGEAHLYAFGIGVGAMVDALIEGCAPSPFWVHGEFDVAISLPWPLPDISASISLTWGGDDGTVPTPPLALSRVEAVAIDHRHVGDHWPLLVHGDHGIPDPMLDYEGGGDIHGMLGLSTSDSTWTARQSANNGLDATPDVDDPHLAKGIVPIVPQDAHFTLTFSHPAVDAAGDSGGMKFTGAEVATKLPIEDTAIGPDVWDKLSPGGEMKDDMSNLTLSPPRPRYAYQNNLRQVSIYRRDGTDWTLVADSQGGGLSDISLEGEWHDDTLPGSEVKQRPNIALHVRTVITVAGVAGSADFTSVKYLEKLGRSFSVGGAAFAVPAGIEAWGNGSGISMRPAAPTGGARQVTITLPQAEWLDRIVGWSQIRDGEFEIRDSPPVTADGTSLGFTLDTSSWPPVMVPAEIRRVRTLVITIPDNAELVMEKIEWKEPDRKLPILPTAPALYAFKTVTEIDARRLGDNSAPAPAPGANPVIEFAYFQTVTGPGLVDLVHGNIAAGLPPPAVGIPAPDLPLMPSQAPSVLARFPEPGQSPRTGALISLDSYSQWSWPGDGERAAYYGYDLNVEFNESYVNALYMAAAKGSGFVGGRGGSTMTQSLHLRCRDRNHNHTLVPTIAVTVPSAPQQSAVVGTPLTPPMPPAISGVAAMPNHVRDEVALAVALQETPGPVVSDGGGQANSSSAQPGSARGPVQPLGAIKPATLSESARVAITAIAADKGVKLAPADMAVGEQVSDGLIAIINEFLLEEEAAAEARALWPLSLMPLARYEVDVVAGPIPMPSRRQYDLAGGQDAISIRDTLLELWRAEDALTPLHTLHFATSRYADFSAHMRSAVMQVGVPTAANPVRRYHAAASPDTWLAGGGSGEATRTAAWQAYVDARTVLEGAINGLDPSIPGAEAVLQQQRDAVEAAWQAYGSASAAVFDGLVAALGLPELASQRTVPPPPNTELSVIVDDNDNVLALLIHSPEPVPWRRLWNWTSLDPGDAGATPLDGVIPLWSSDATRSLVLPVGTASGSYRLRMLFQGNVGPEIASITRDGSPVEEEVLFAQILFAKEQPVHHHVGLAGLASRVQLVSPP